MILYFHSLFFSPRASLTRENGGAQSQRVQYVSLCDCKETCKIIQSFAAHTLCDFKKRTDFLVEFSSAYSMRKQRKQNNSYVVFLYSLCTNSIENTAIDSIVYRIVLSRIYANLKTTSLPFPSVRAEGKWTVCMFSLKHTVFAFVKKQRSVIMSNNSVLYLRQNIAFHISINMTQLQTALTCRGIRIHLRKEMRSVRWEVSGNLSLSCFDEMRARDVLNISPFWREALTGLENKKVVEECIKNESF